MNTHTVIQFKALYTASVKMKFIIVKVAFFIGSVVIIHRTFY